MNFKTRLLIFGSGRYLFQLRELSFSVMRLVFIYGPPASGKLTVATELAKLTGFKLFHNHVSIQFVQSIFEFGTKTFWASHRQISTRDDRTSGEGWNRYNFHICLQQRGGRPVCWGCSQKCQISSRAGMFRAALLRPERIG